jgi:hypothetical protein
MNIIGLVQKLRDLEQALETEDATKVRNMVIDARECAIEIERDSPEQRRRTSRLSQPA